MCFYPPPIAAQKPNSTSLKYVNISSELQDALEFRPSTLLPHADQLPDGMLVPAFYLDLVLTALLSNLRNAGCSWVSPPLPHAPELPDGMPVRDPHLLVWPHFKGRVRQARHWALERC